MAGERVYGVIGTAMYPPATYAMLWPFVGYPSFPLVRIIWAATGLISLLLLLWIGVSEGGRWPWQIRLLVGAAVLSNYAISVAVATGQMSLQVLPPVILSILIVTRGNVSVRRDVLAAGLFVLGMAKPQIALPFGWILLYVPGRWRPVLFAVGMYIAVTLFAAMFQK